MTIEVRNLRTHFATRAGVVKAVDDVSFTVRSGEVLVSAKEDLSDHKRWLEIQRAAGQADRLRHERWLERQREKQEALERREEAKRRRKLMRQRAMSAMDARLGVVLVPKLVWRLMIWL